MPSGVGGGLGVGSWLGVGSGVGPGVSVGMGVGSWVGVGSGVGSSEGAGVGVGSGLGVGVGSAVGGGRRRGRRLLEGQRRKPEEAVLRGEGAAAAHRQQFTPGLGLGQDLPREGRPLHRAAAAVNQPPLLVHGAELAAG